jgi:serine phosphatase RsbU (regulator of sigma subunit)
MTYSAKLVLGACGLVLMTGGVITWVAHRAATAATERLAQSLFREASGHAVTHTRDYLLRAAPLVDTLRQLAGDALAMDEPEALARQLLAVLRANPGLTWVSYGGDDGAFTGAYRTPDGQMRINRSMIVDGRSHLTEDDVLPDGARRTVRRDDDSGYDPRTRPFYVKARQRGQTVWLPPYVFYNQGVPGISCATPVYDQRSGALRGVLSIDFDLNSLSDFVSSLAISEHGRVFIFTADGVLLAKPGARWRGSSGQRGSGALPLIAEARDPLVRAFAGRGRALTTQPQAGGSGDLAFEFFPLRSDDTDYLASTTPFRVGDDQTWIVGAISPRSDFLADVWRSRTLAIAATTGALLAAMLLAALMARRVSGPVRSLVGFMRRVGDGDLDARAEFGTSREFRDLSNALNRMIADLRDRLRLRHSLNVAMEVQQRLLPSHPPVVPGLDIAGHSTYCDETGGDYYDFLVVDDAAPGKVLIALGDVMGHGVAAALVMAGARAVLRDRVADAGSLAEVINRLNRTLASDLDGSRFMTMHLAVVDTTTSTYRWASAGHDPAIMYDPAADTFEEHDEGGLPLGVLADADYEEYSRGPFGPGRVIVVGTDGIWEMPGPGGEQFGKDRLRAVIRRSAARSAGEIVDAIVSELANFRGACRPVDDVTLIVIKMCPANAAIDRAECAKRDARMA